MLYVVKLINGKYAVANVQSQRVVSVHKTISGAVALASALNG